MTIKIIDVFPLPVIYIITAVIILIAMELGWRYGNYRRRRAEEENKAPVSAAVGATVGLLAFLLAFTFGMAESRYNNRKQVVLLEANAIGTTYLRTDFLSEQARDEARNLLREYAALRSRGANTVMSPEGMLKTSYILDRLWAIAANAGTKSDSITTGLFTQSLNEMIDIDAVRLAALRNRIPDSIWFMLCVVTLVSMFSMGYQFGLTGIHSWAGTILLVIVFTTVFTLIADLDRPQDGLVQVSQQSLIDLVNKIGPPVP